MAEVPNKGLLNFIKKWALVPKDSTDKLSDIKNNYESIFSWNICETTEQYRTKESNFLRKIQEKQDLSVTKKSIFNFDQFCWKLISCFETFLHFERFQALSEIKDLIDTLRCVQLDTFFDQISNVCFHIAYATQSYIMFHIDNDFQKILSNIKPMASFNKIEKAAVYAIKSKIFLEYSPEGNDIALNFAESARNFNDAEMYWIHIWLKAKRRKRRYDKNPSYPLRDELDAAKKLSECFPNLELLLTAASVYVEAGNALSLKPSFVNLRESKRFKKLTANLILNVYGSANNDPKLLYQCLSTINNLPTSMIPRYILDDIVDSLQKIDNYKIYNVLGKYFLHIKNYAIARDYFKKASSIESFSSSLLLLKAECLLKPLDDFPVIPYLKLLYNSYSCSKKRRCVSAQILLYYMYNENNTTNKRDLLYSLNSYLNEHVDFVQKKNYVTDIYPYYQLKNKFKPKTFIKDLTNNIEQLKAYRNWNFREKCTLNKVVSKFTIVCKSEQNEILFNSDLACVVCENDTACYALQPCGHQCVCKNCWSFIQNHGNLCPLCRAMVHHYLIC